MALVGWNYAKLQKLILKFVKSHIPNKKATLFILRHALIF